MESRIAQVLKNPDEVQFNLRQLIQIFALIERGSK